MYAYAIIVTKGIIVAIIYENDTISAQATPFGIGAVAVIRMSGAKAFEITEKIFDKKLIPGKIMYGTISDEGQVIDEVVVLPFKSGYTGENSVEIQCHGGIKIANKIKSLTYKYGARPAEKGEFTKRAFLNGKMDLTKAEAVADIIHAKTEKFALKSAQNLKGKLSEETNFLYGKLFDLLSKIIAATDFPEDVEEPEYSYLEKEIIEVSSQIKKILEFAKSSDLLRQGAKIALVGKPNAGKSSLFNALLNLERAIVTDIEGTTRDILTETLDIDGMPVTFIDTAGLRDNSRADEIEKIGMNFTEKAAVNSDLVLFLFDGIKGITDEDYKILANFKGKKIIRIATKSDISGKKYEDCLNLSSVTGENVEFLKNKIKEELCGNFDVEPEYVTNERQQHCLKKALEFCDFALEGISAKMPQDLISTDIKSALLSIGEIKGEIVTDDILNNIFDNFCIGK